MAAGAPRRGALGWRKRATEGGLRGGCAMSGSLERGLIKGLECDPASGLGATEIAHHNGGMLSQGLLQHVQTESVAMCDG